MNKTDIPARHDGPITYSSNIMTVATCRGLIHKKCKYKVTFWKRIIAVRGQMDGSADGNTQTRHMITSSNLLTSLDRRFTICPVVVWANALLFRQRAFAETETASIKIQHTAEKQQWRDASVGAHLPIDHVAQSHADLHPNPLDVVEVEMMKHGEDEGGQRDACGVHVGLVGPRCAGGVVALEEPDDLPEQHRLDDLDDFLIEKMKAVRARATLGSTTPF